MSQCCINVWMRVGLLTGGMGHNVGCKGRSFQDFTRLIKGCIEEEVEKIKG